MNQKTVRGSAMIAIALAGLVSGCMDTTPTGTQPLVNHLSFSYSGAVSGTFDATGDPQPAVDFVIPRADYAGAITYDASVSVPLAGTISVIANDDAGAPYGNMFRLAKIPTQVGTYSFSNGIGGLLQLSLTWTPADFGAQQSFLLTSGQISVVRYTGVHVLGTFSGTATQIDPAPSGPAPQIAITNGQFDLTINDPDIVPVRCFLFAC